ncbi:MAG: hypothetical protein HKP39_09785 [Eudoraea sp.]|nr:hypothetical protein [Eudoraea sp.]
MNNSERLLTARVIVGLTVIAVITVVLVIYHEYSAEIAKEVEVVLASSLENFDNTLASNY